MGLQKMLSLKKKSCHREAVGSMRSGGFNREEKTVPPLEIR
jgi:hypothetical protein